ncbi:MAG: thiamine pyrophosphate-binding protein [Rhodospirillales bacterium]
MDEAPTGGTLLADALVAHEVETLYCVPGESFLGLLDALYQLDGRIRVIACRHEHGASMMAEATGKLRGRPGICAVTRGPGACNAAIGVHTAFQDSTPMLLIVGQVASAYLGREAFQEIDVVAMFRPIAKHVEQVQDASSMASAVIRAMQLAQSGRAGPVVLVVPEDVLRAPAESAPRIALPVGSRTPAAGQMERLHQILGEAERPVMLLGGSGWTDRARQDIARFAINTQLPVVSSFRRNDLFPNSDPHWIGELGMGARPSLIERIRAADVLLVVGARLGEATSQAYTLFDTDEPPTLVHVHPDGKEIGRVFPAALAIPCDVAGFASAACRLPPLWGERWLEWTQAARHDFERDRLGESMAAPLDLHAVMATLDLALPKDAIVTVDAGNFSGWPQRFLSFGGDRRLLGATNGAMGYAVPAAVAASLAAPQRIVVACVGDGGFGMTGAELATAVNAGARPIVLVFDNGMYGTIRMHQERRYPGRPIATSLGSVDYAEFARAFGAEAETVIKTAQFGPALDRALNCGRAAVIHLKCDPRQLTTRQTVAEVSAEARR